MLSKITELLGIPLRLVKNNNQAFYWLFLPPLTSWLLYKQYLRVTSHVCPVTWKVSKKWISARPLLSSLADSNCSQRDQLLPLFALVKLDSLWFLQKEAWNWNSILSWKIFKGMLYRATNKHFCYMMHHQFWITGFGYYRWKFRNRLPCLFSLVCIYFSFYLSPPLGPGNSNNILTRYSTISRMKLQINALLY